MSLVVIKGTPALVWGTSNQVGANAPSGAIVASLRLTPKNGGPAAEIEDNNAIAANLVLLRDGFNARAEIMNDTNKVYPVEGANVGISLQINGANANSYPFGEGAAASYANGVVTYFCTLISIEPSSARRKEQMLDLNLAYRPNITP